MWLVSAKYDPVSRPADRTLILEIKETRFNIKGFLRELSTAALNHETTVYFDVTWDPEVQDANSYASYERLTAISRLCVT